MKKCSRCGVVKPLEDFAKSSVKKDGRTYSCKVCIEIGRKERLATNPEKAALIRERDAARKREKAAEIYQKIKQRKESDAEYAERLKSYSQRYAEKNREKELKRGRDYRLSITDDDKAREERNAYMREWTSRNSERLNRERREKLKNDPEYAEKVRRRNRERYEESPHSRRTIALKTQYGISIEDYNRMYDEQQGKCMICNTPRVNGGKDGLVVDHCHTTGDVRGLLCPSCNTGIGHMKDDVQSLGRAIEYLKERG